MRSLMIYQQAKTGRPICPLRLNFLPRQQNTPFHMTVTLNRILVANRGEIAVRVIRTCQKLGLETVAVYSDSDSESLFVKMATMAVHIGDSISSESYLRIDKVVKAALDTQSDAIHPGYGFLSENANFAKECEKHGIIFIGPKPESIIAIGDKIGAKVLLRKKAPEVPLIPGYDDNDQSVERIRQECLNIGFPILLKASSGGGGKGMRVVREIANLEEEIEMAKGEALRSFGDDKLLIEKYFEEVKHVEVQIIGDDHGNIYHCFERECSVQRRHQKVIEETPAVILDDDLRQKMTSVAVTIGKSIDYIGAGTVEFILDAKTRKFYFLEVNTRLQVEHPITEAITGLDLVELQLRVASGENLSKLKFQEIKPKGHAIEARLYAEDPTKNFFPCTGTILLWREDRNLSSEYPRYDTGVASGTDISIFYDPLISKITVWAPNRNLAMAMMKKALRNTVCLGLTTNKSFLLGILQQRKFLDGSYTTRLVESMTHDGIPLGFDYKLLDTDKFVPVEHLSCEKIPELKNLSENPSQMNVKIQPNIDSFRLSLAQEITIASLLWVLKQRMEKRKQWKSIGGDWRLVRWRPSMEQFLIKDSGSDIPINVEYLSIDNRYGRNNRGPWKYAIRFVDLKNAGSEENQIEVVTKATKWFQVELRNSDSTHSGYSISGKLECVISNTRMTYLLSETTNIGGIPNIYLHSANWDTQFTVERLDPLRDRAIAKDDPLSSYTSSMPCRILKLLVNNNSNVKPGDPLLTMESMKMETRLYSKHKGKVKYLVKEGDIVDAGSLMLKVE